MARKIFVSCTVLPLLLSFSACQNIDLLQILQCVVTKQLQDCATPDSAGTFSPTDPAAYCWIQFQNARKGDTVMWQWYGPSSAEIYQSESYTFAEAQVDGCLSSSLDIKQNAPALMPGVWTVKVYGNGTICFTKYFEISAGTTTTVSGDDQNLGLDWTKDEWDNTETDIKLGADRSLPAKVDLSGQFPPIGDQNPYGTCVAWAVGYNLKSYLEGVDQGVVPSSPERQFSPKFLFWEIDANKKGADCNGTQFEYALDVLMTTGIATLATVPYNSLGDCNPAPGAIPQRWLDEAKNYLIANYRKINHQSVTDIKSYLADGRPVVFGAGLGDNFMAWNSDEVLATDTDTYQGRDANHAMVLAGYDDSRGTGGAFLVRNSWGTGWGNNGTIWVDYNFFVNQFCFCAFVAQNTRSDDDFEPDNPDTYDPPTGYDLISLGVATYEDDSDVLYLGYYVYNIGQADVSYTQDWSIVFLYYNAYDANEFGVLAFDHFSDDFGDMQPVSLDLGSGPVTGYNYHIDLPTGTPFMRYYDPDSGFNNLLPFTLPYGLNGSYYLVLIADGLNTIDEYDEANNYVWLSEDPVVIDTTGASGGLLGLHAGTRKSQKYIAPLPPDIISRTYTDPPIRSKYPNAYTPREIKRLLQHHAQTGELYRKIEKFRAAAGVPRPLPPDTAGHLPPGLTPPPGN